MSKRSRHRHDDQADLFEATTLFAVKPPASMPRALDFNRRLAIAMAEAIRESGRSRDDIAAEMTSTLGYEDAEVTVAMLNAYTSAARETHNISVVRLLAFARATRAPWLWEVVLHEEGLTLLQGEEALHAQASLLRKQGQALLEQADAKLSAAPLQVRMTRGRR
jgi:hypothetical protein